jgi:diacylglycerol kinase (ATP)
VRFIIVLNPAAGKGQARRRLGRALEVLRSAGIAWEIRESRAAAHLTDLARAAAADRPDAVVSAGGDGTHHFVLNGLAGEDVPLGLLPVGSGNDLELGLGVPADLRAAAGLLAAFRIQSIDLVRVGKAYYACMGGAGWDSIVNRYANEEVNWLTGPPKYLWALARCLKFYRPFSVEIRSEGGNYSGDVLFLGLGNAPSYGAGLKLTPRARMDDGLVDVCVVPFIPKLELLRWLPAVFTGAHLRHPRIQYFQCRRLEILGPASVEFFGDGEFMQTLPATVEVVPRALRVIVPQVPGGSGS